MYTKKASMPSDAMSWCCSVTQHTCVGSETIVPMQTSSPACIAHTSRQLIERSRLEVMLT